MINTNLPPILHRFRDIAFDSFKIAIYLATVVVFNSPTEGFLWDDLRKIFGRPFVKQFALCYQTVDCPVCLSVSFLSVTLVHCGQTVGPIKM